jgi:hypothetical protein
MNIFENWLEEVNNGTVKFDQELNPYSPLLLQLTDEELKQMKSIKGNPFIDLLLDRH